MPEQTEFPTDETSEPSNTDTSSNTAASPAVTGSDAVAAALESTGVETLFGVQGGAIMPVYDSLHDADLSHVTMAHEQGAVHAADAYGVVTGSPGVCLATSGPGATNLVTGLADADMDSDRLLALTGQVPTDLVGTDAFQETDTVGVTGPTTKENYFVKDPDRLGETVSEAFFRAKNGRPGPTLVDLPKDVTMAELDDLSEPTRPEPDAGPSTEADPDAVQLAAEALAAADRPTVVAGGGVIKGAASEELRQFAMENQLPVVTTMPGMGSFPESHDLAMEVAGMHGTGYANLALQHCDVMLAVGTRFDDRLTGGLDTFAPDAEVIHVDIDPSEISKNVPATHPLVGDAGSVLSQLAQAMPDTPDTDDWCAQCQAWKQEYPLEYDQSTEGPLKPQYVVEQLDDLTPDDTIVTTGVGQHQMWAMQYWTFRKPRTWVSSNGLGTMGYGLPASIGARMAADPDQSVVSFEGDGSFLMTVQELAVAVRENLDITVVVLNNEAIGLVRQWQDAFFDGRRMASEYSWVPKLDALAESFGARGFRVDSADEVTATLRAALEYDGPSVVDAYVNPEEDVYPMVPSGGDNGQFAMNNEELEQLK